jgi:hypothetical protein
LPFQDKDMDFKSTYNVWEVYRNYLDGKNMTIKKGKYNYKIDKTSTKWFSWDDWCREVIWYGNKRAAYLYSCKNLKL